VRRFNKSSKDLKRRLASDVRCVLMSFPGACQYIRCDCTAFANSDRLTRHSERAQKAALSANIASYATDSPMPVVPAAREAQGQAMLSTVKAMTQAGRKRHAGVSPSRRRLDKVR
jgi:hypothetical protein